MDGLVFTTSASTLKLKNQECETARQDHIFSTPRLKVNMLLGVITKTFRRKNIPLYISLHLIFNRFNEKHSLQYPYDSYPNNFANKTYN